MDRKKKRRRYYIDRPLNWPINFEFLSFLNNDNDPLGPNACWSFDHRVLFVLRFPISRTETVRVNRTERYPTAVTVVPFLKNERNAVDSFDDVISTDYMLRGGFFLILAVQKPRKNNRTISKEPVKHSYTTRLSGLP